MKHELMKKLMEKKAGKQLSPNEQKAKMSVVEDLQKMAQDAMGSKIHGLKKVTVASPDKEGLEHGLDKAKEIVESQLPEAEEDAIHEAGESTEEEIQEHMLDEDEEQGEEPEMSEEELDQKLEELMKKKAMLKKKV